MERSAIRGRRMAEGRNRQRALCLARGGDHLRDRRGEL